MGPTRLVNAETDELATSPVVSMDVVSTQSVTLPDGRVVSVEDIPAHSSFVPTPLEPYIGAMEGLRGNYMPQDRLEIRFGKLLVDPKIIPDHLYAGPAGGDGGTVLEFFDRQLDPADFDDEGDHFGYIWVSSEQRVDDESGGVFDRPGFRYAPVFSLESAEKNV